MIAPKNTFSTAVPRKLPRDDPDHGFVAALMLDVFLGYVRLLALVPRTFVGRVDEVGSACGFTMAKSQNGSRILVKTGK